MKILKKCQSWYNVHNYNDENANHRICNFSPFILGREIICSVSHIKYSTTKKYWIWFANQENTLFGIKSNLDPCISYSKKLQIKN